MREQLEALRSELEAAEPTDWSVIDLWSARAIPIFKVGFGQHFEEFQAVCTKPRRVARASFVQQGDTAKLARMSEEARLSRARECEQGINKILNFLDGILRLIPEHPLMPLRRELEGVPVLPWSGIQIWVAKGGVAIRNQYPEHFEAFSQVAAEPKRKIYAVLDGVVSASAARAKIEDETEANQSVKNALLSFLDGLMAIQPSLGSGPSTVTPTNFDAILSLCRSFPRFARQLQERDRSKPPLLIEDEYDLQYLFHALLKLDFPRVKAEEYTPSYAAKSSRIDFYLKADGIALELKLTSPTLRDKELGKQLIDDSRRYRQVPGCKALVCYVHDEGHLREPETLEEELSGVFDGLEVRVIISSSRNH